MEKGDFFGEQALYYKTVRSCSVQALSEVKCLALGREVIQKILGEQIQIITFKNIMRWAFERNRRLMKLTASQIEKIMENMNTHKFQKDQIVFKKNEVCDTFVILLEGGLKNVKKIVFYL